MHAVESTNLEAVGWQTDGTLTVRFKSGHVYQYRGVERGVYLALLKSESKGKFFHAMIRNNYEFTRLQGEQE